MKQNRILALLLALVLALSTIGVAEEIVDTEWTVVEDGEAVEEALPIEEEEAEAKSKLEDFTLENGVITAYNGIDTKVVIDAKWGVIAIGEGAFAGKPIVSITIPATVTKIGASAFECCEKLKTVKLNKGLTSIGSSAFRECAALTSITLPATLTEIGNSAFSDSGVKSVKIPDGVTEISVYAFAHCANLTSVTLGKNVQAICDNAFTDCEKLSSVKFNDNLQSIGIEAFDGCSSLKSVKLGKQCSKIGVAAFNGCKKLATVTLSPVSTTIRWLAFARCTSLKTIDLTNAEFIEEEAFMDCIALKTVKMGAILDPDAISDNAFDRCPDTMTWNVYLDTCPEECAKAKGYTVTYRKDYTFVADEKSINRVIGEYVEAPFVASPVLPETADVTFKASNAKVLEKTEEDFFTIAEGSSNVTATCTIPDPNNPKKNLFKKSATVKVKVYDPNKLASVTIDNDPKFTMDINTEMDLQTVPYPYSADDLTTTWKSSNAKVATVGETTGTLKGVAEGTATITATVQQLKNKIKKTASVKVTVVNPDKLTGLKIDEATKTTMVVGSTGTVAAVTEPASAEDTTSITYKSSNTSVVKVDATTGAVEALKKGTATITATGVQGKVKKTATVKIAVKDWETFSGLKIINGYTNEPVEDTFEMGRRGSLSVSVPEATGELTYKWSISDDYEIWFANPENVNESSVELGAGDAGGFTTVTVEVTDNVNYKRGTVSCDVLAGIPGLVPVFEDGTPIPETIELEVGQTCTLTWKATYDMPGEGYGIEWDFDDPEFASPEEGDECHDNTVTFKALKPGTCPVVLEVGKDIPGSDYSRFNYQIFDVHVVEHWETFSDLKIINGFTNEPVEDTFEMGRRGSLSVSVPEATGELTYKWSISDDYDIWFANPENVNESSVELGADDIGFTTITVEVTDNVNYKRGTVSCDVLAGIPGLVPVFEDGTMIPGTIELEVGQTCTLTWKATYDMPGEGYGIEWDFDDPEFASPEEGDECYENTVTFKALKPGTCPVVLEVGKDIPGSDYSRFNYQIFDVHVVEHWETFSDLKIINGFTNEPVEDTFEMGRRGSLSVSVPEATGELTYKWSIADNEDIRFANPENVNESSVELDGYAGFTTVTVEVTDNVNYKRGTVSCDVLVGMPGLWPAFEDGTPIPGTIELEVGQTCTITWKASYDLPGEGYDVSWDFDEPEFAAPVDCEEDRWCYGNSVTIKALKLGTCPVVLDVGKDVPGSDYRRSDFQCFDVHVVEPLDMTLYPAWGGFYELDYIRAPYNEDDTLVLEVRSPDTDFNCDTAICTWELSNQSVLKSIHDPDEEDEEYYEDEVYTRWNNDFHILGEGEVIVKCHVVCGDKAGDVEFLVNTHNVYDEEISDLKIVNPDGTPINGTIEVPVGESLKLKWATEDARITTSEPTLAEWSSTEEWMHTENRYANEVEFIADEAGETEIEVMVHWEYMDGSAKINVKAVE